MPLIVAGAAVLVVLAGIAAMLALRRGQTATAGSVPVTIQASAGGAGIFVDGNQCGTGTCTVELAPGKHRAEARLAGYQESILTFDVAKDSKSAPPIQLALTPRPPLVILSSDLSGAQVLVNGAVAGQIEGSDLEVDNLSAANNTIELKAKNGGAQMDTTFGHGTLPAISSLTTKE